MAATAAAKFTNPLSGKHPFVVRAYLAQIVLLLKRLSVAYALYFVARLLFFLFNRHHFAGTGAAGFLRDAFVGLRFDSFSIVVSNALFILLSLMPTNVVVRRGYQQVLRWLFVVANMIFAAANFIDVGYYDFTRKRSTSDLFEQLGGQSDVAALIPRILSDFWPVIALFVVCCWLLDAGYRRMRMAETKQPAEKGIFRPAACVGIFLVVTGLSVLAVRGGLQRVPIDIVNAGASVPAGEVPIVLNTPFTLIKSAGRKPLKEVNYFTDAELQRIYSPVHEFKSGRFERKNVVVLILESFSKEYTKLGGAYHLTPFLDSLMDHSLVWKNAYSNGTKSIEGIPAILSSMPSLMENPFINSMYANNFQTSFASLLKDEGYSTAFFHGGINGTMNFDDWAKLAGYDHYYGRNEYMNDTEFDGYWGIWDEPFLQFAAKRMNDMPGPFHAAVFTLSSHHPYFVPKKYKERFAGGPLENSSSIRYADYSLRKFFETAAQLPWYRNTLFVLCADHAGISEHPFYSRPPGYFSIPILFFSPGESLTGEDRTVRSQIDILPATMRMLGYKKRFFAFGEGYTNGVSLSPWYSDGIDYMITDSLLYGFRDGELSSCSRFHGDSTVWESQPGTYRRLDSTVTSRFHAFIQAYYRTLNRNEGVAGLRRSE